MEKRYHIISYGCQMNVYDSQLIGRILWEDGWEETHYPDRADLILVNTCSVRQHAEDRVWGRLGVLKGLKSGMPDLVIGVCGCMAQRVGNEIRKRVPEVDFVVGPDNYREIPGLIERGGYSLTQGGDFYSDLFPVNGTTVSQFIPVMRGCDNFCAYCIVPWVRGKERHRPAEDISNEARALARSGVKEITLLGQSVNSYKNGTDFAGLLKELDSIEGIERIRFTTSHPKDLSRDILTQMRDCAKVCEHLHLPLQSGSTKVLKLMNRGYTKDEYLELIQRARRTVPGLSITTDIMVGFPGETEEDFEETLGVVRSVRFDFAYMFRFSPREGTPAVEFANQVPPGERAERLSRLIEVQYQTTKVKASELVGKRVEVLVAGRSKRNKGESCGRTRTNKLVVFPGEDSEGELIWVEISQLRGSTPYGEKVGQNKKGGSR